MQIARLRTLITLKGLSLCTLLVALITSFSSEECQKCFTEAVSKKGGRQNKAAMMTKITDCSEQHLSPLYDSCTEMMKSQTADKGETFKCYQRVLLSSLVMECSKDISEATADSLDAVMDCGKEQVMEFMAENARSVYGYTFFRHHVKTVS